MSLVEVADTTASRRDCDVGHVQESLLENCMLESQGPVLDVRSAVVAIKGVSCKGWLPGPRRRTG